MAATNLTKRTVDALEYRPSGDYVVWDAKLKGFGVRVTEHTDKRGEVHRRKSFMVGYRLPAEPVNEFETPGGLSLLNYVL